MSVNPTQSSNQGSYIGAAATGAVVGGVAGLIPAAFRKTGQLSGDPSLIQDVLDIKKGEPGHLSYFKDYTNVKTLKQAAKPMEAAAQALKETKVKIKEMMASVKNGVPAEKTLTREVAKDLFKTATANLEKAKAEATKILERGTRPLAKYAAIGAAAMAAVGIALHAYNTSAEDKNQPQEIA